MIIATHGILASQLAGFDADAQAFFDRVTTAGGTLSATEKTAVNQLVLDMKSYSIWSKMKAIYPMVGASAAACAQNLKSSSFTGTFTSGWTFASTGVTPNGTSAYMNTNYNISSNWSLSNAHASFYSRTNLQNDSFGGEMGVDGSYLGNEAFLLRCRNSSGGGIGAFVLGQDNAVTISNTNGDGFFLGLNLSLTNRKFLRNNNLLVSSTLNNAGSLRNINVIIGAATSALFSKNECAFSSMGESLTDTEAGNFYTAVQAFQTTLSRNV